MIAYLHHQVLPFSGYLLLLTAVGTAENFYGQSSYEQSIQAWRIEREAKLRSDDGWLTVSGLFWLKEGENDFGADASGRFLYAEPPKNDQAVLDFNQAINPPCAFTAYATCPLPPKQNWLRVAIEAGELATHPGDGNSADQAGRTR